MLEPLDMPSLAPHLGTTRRRPNMEASTSTQRLFCFVFFLRPPFYFLRVPISIHLWSLQLRWLFTLLFELAGLQLCMVHRTALLAT